MGPRFGNWRQAFGLLTATSVAGLIIASPAKAENCAKSVFEAVVGEAAGALRDLNTTMRPPFQQKLRELKEKRGWTQDEFLTRAAPLVQDDRISEFDDTSAEMLTEIESMGAEGAKAAPDCVRLAEVRARMAKLVEVQKAKWAYMFGKVETELGK